MRRDKRIGVSTLVPMAFVQSVRRSTEFYQRLGFAVDHTHAPEAGAEPVWASLNCEEAHLMLSQASEPVDPTTQGVLFYLYCNDVAEFRSELLDSGVELGPVQHPFYAPRGEFRVIDPDGYVLMVTHT